MSTTSTTSDSHGHHDWHSASYVDNWISSDATSDGERQPWLRRLAQLLPFEQTDSIRVLDVGAGYAALTREIVDAYPNAAVVLHDFSEPMLDHARQRLQDVAERVSYATADLRDPGWTAAFDSDFDAVVSSIAIHNVRDPAMIRRIYADIRPLVRSGGCFYNVDFVMPAGPLSGAALWGERGRNLRAAALGELPTLEGHLSWLRAAGFDEADCLFRVDAQALVAGFVA